MQNDTKTTIAMAAVAVGLIAGQAHAMNGASASGAKVEPTPCSIQLWTGNTDTAAKCEAAGGTWNRGASAGGPKSGGSSSGQAEVINNPALFIGRTNSMLNGR